MRASTARSRTAKHQANLAQLSLFDIALEGTVAVANDADAAPMARSSMAPIKAPSERAKRSAAKRQVIGSQVSQLASRILTQDEMPSYPAEEVEAATLTLKQLPQAQLWFTYKDIRFFFGVSRATVARRLREGLVPGVRMAGSSVVEDSPVRRFDRDQLKWLLLALRHRRRLARGRTR